MRSSDEFDDFEPFILSGIQRLRDKEIHEPESNEPCASLRHLLAWVVGVA